MKFKRQPLIPSLMTLLSIILLCSCAFGSGINQELYQFLEQGAKTAIEQLNQNLAKYEVEAANKGSYESKVEILKLPRFLNTQHIYDELKLIGGYWASDGEKILDTAYISYERDIAGNLHYNYEGMPNEDYIIETYETINSLKENEENLKWSLICKTEAEQVSRDITNLKTLSFGWETSHKDWKAEKISSDVFSISGPDLGLYLDSPSIGTWHYLSNENVFELADKYAQNLYAVMYDRPSYKEKRAMYDLTSPPYEIPNYNYSWLSYQWYYHLPESVPLEITNSRDSEFTKDLFDRYPKLEEYWTMLEELGFNVLCTTVGEENDYYGDYNILLSVNP